VSSEGTVELGEAADATSADGYRYDLFLSYRRTPNVSAWVRNHFHPGLRNCLWDELEYEPQIFLDIEQDPGTPWPEHLKWALQRSRLVVAVLSPPYFTSRWCMAEWQTILRREQREGLDGPGDVAHLLHPVPYSDGDRFPADVSNRQMDPTFKDFRFPQRPFADSVRYLGLHEALVKLAERLAARLDKTPVWRPDWPVVEPEPLEPTPAGVPRF
jgi:hypothetical protein